MDKRELDKLIIKIQDGDENAFAIFYDETYRGLFSFIYSYLKDWHTSEDLMQETFIKVKSNIDKYTLGTNVIAWMFQIAKNLCKDYLKKQNAHRIENIDNVVIEKNYEPERNTFVHDLINKNLQEPDRQIVLLHILFGYKNREIAKILNIPLGTVLWRYNKSIKKLQNKLKEDS